MVFDDIEDAYFAFLPRNAGRVVDPALRQHLDSLSANIQARIERLDTVETGAGTPQSGMYSPLTVTTTGLGITGRDSANLAGPQPQEAPASLPRSPLPLVLGGAALVLVTLIIAYLAFVVRGGG